jgi:hypothetical protein
MAKTFRSKVAITIAALITVTLIILSYFLIYLPRERDAALKKAEAMRRTVKLGSVRISHLKKRDN